MSCYPPKPKGSSGAGEDRETERETKCVEKATLQHLQPLLEGRTPLRNPSRGTERISTQASVSSWPQTSWHYFPLAVPPLECLRRWELIHVVQLGQPGTQSSGGKGSQRDKQKLCSTVSARKVVVHFTIRILPRNPSVLPHSANHLCLVALCQALCFGGYRDGYGMILLTLTVFREFVKHFSLAGVFFGFCFKFYHFLLKYS